ncbi:hypothetical protein JCM1841_002345 [Sporobolomyces salmonicolor]
MVRYVPSAAYTLDRRHEVRFARLFPLSDLATRSTLELALTWLLPGHMAAYILVTLFVAVMINFGRMKLYGEMEFWFTDIHFITVMGPILLGLVFAGGGGPNHHALSGENWRNPGRFTQYLRIEGSLGHFLEFWAVLVQSAFSYIGSHLLFPTIYIAKWAWNKYVPCGEYVSLPFFRRPLYVGPTLP